MKRIRPVQCPHPLDEALLVTAQELEVDGTCGVDAASAVVQRVVVVLVKRFGKFSVMQAIDGVRHEIMIGDLGRGDF